MEPHKIVSQDEWIAARKAHLAEEKAITQTRDELSRKRRELPWVKVEKNYVFDTPSGKRTLADLFGSKSQLIVYHFMLGPVGRRLPELLATRRSFRRRRHPPRAARHDLRRGLARAAGGDRRVQGAHGLEIQMGVVVRQRFQPRLSGVGIARGRKVNGKVLYNYEVIEKFPSEERPGASVFYKNRGRRGFSHLFDLWPRSRHSGRRLQSPRSWRQRAATRLDLPFRWPGSATTIATKARWSIQKRHTSNPNPPHAAISPPTVHNNVGVDHEALWFSRLAKYLEGACARRLSENPLEFELVDLLKGAQQTPAYPRAQSDRPNPGAGRRRFQAVGIQRDPAIHCQQEPDAGLSERCQGPRRRQPLAMLGTRALGRAGLPAADVRESGQEIRQSRRSRPGGRSPRPPRPSTRKPKRSMRIWRGTNISSTIR